MFICMCIYNYVCVYVKAKEYVYIYIYICLEKTVHLDMSWRGLMHCYLIGTLRGVGGRGVGDYTSLNRPY